MNHQFKNQARIIKLLFLFYLLPLVAILFYANQFVPSQKTWILLPIGLLLAVSGVLVVYLSVRKWEAQLVEALSTSNPPVIFSSQETFQPYVAKVETAPTPSFSQEPSQLREELENQRRQLELCQRDFDQKQQEVFKLNKDNERYQRQAELVLQEFAQYKKAAQEQIEQKGSLLADFQQSLSEQKAVIEKKQHQISQLESKVQDLTYEIKTLLQLADLGHMPEEHKTKASIKDVILEETPIISELQVKSAEEAVVQLRKCIDIAQKMTGSSHLSSQAMTRFLGEDHLAIDYRRLFDNLRAENGATVFFYSQKENKMLFVNNQCRQLLGWTPEKFIQNFSEINHQEDEWKQALSQLLVHPEAKINLMMKTKNGQDTLVQGLLGNIPTGLFKHNVIGVLF